MRSEVRAFKKSIKPFKQGYVAEQLQITQAYLSQVLRGRRTPSEKIIRRMGEFISVHRVKINQVESQGVAE